MYIWPILITWNCNIISRHFNIWTTMCDVSVWTRSIEGNDTIRIPLMFYIFLLMFYSLPSILIVGNCIFNFNPCISFNIRLSTFKLKHLILTISNMLLLQPCADYRCYSIILTRSVRGGVLWRRRQESIP